MKRDPLYRLEAELAARLLKMIDDAFDIESPLGHLPGEGQSERFSSACANAARLLGHYGLQILELRAARDRIEQLEFVGEQLAACLRPRVHDDDGGTDIALGVLQDWADLEPLAEARAEYRARKAEE